MEKRWVTISAVTEEFNGTSYGLFDYQPAVGQPGYSTYNPGTTTGCIYSFTSDDTGTWSVPDGGATVGLLGMALAGMAVIRRKLAK